MRMWLVVATDVLFGERFARLRAETRDEALHHAQALAPRWKGGCWEVSELHGPVTCCRGEREGQLRWCTPECGCPKCLTAYEAGIDLDASFDHSDEDHDLELADRRCDAARERSCS